MQLETPTPEPTNGDRQDTESVLATMTPRQLLAVANIVSREPARLAVRDALVCILLVQRQAACSASDPAREHLSQVPPTSASEAARWLHTRLLDPGSGWQAEILRTLNRLARGAGVLSADRIERIVARSHTGPAQPR